MFWNSKNTIVMSSSTINALPPAASCENLADRPIVLKKTSNKVSRIPRSNVTRRSAKTVSKATHTLQINPPVTAEGML